MNLNNRIITIVFFIITAPIIAIAGLVVSSIIEPDNRLLSADLKKSLNWFSQNVDLSKNIVTGLYILAGVFVALALYNILAAAFDRGSDDDLR